MIKTSRSSLTSVCILTGMCLSVILAVSAFTAVGNWNELSKDIEDQAGDDYDIVLGYSWYLMLFSGVMAVGVAGMSAVAFCRYRNSSEEGSFPLNRT